MRKPISLLTPYLLSSSLLTVVIFCSLAFLPSSRVSAQYCIPTYGNLCSSGDLINNFSFNTILNNNSNCNSQVNNYIYYNNLSTTVAPGQTYALSMQSGSAWGQGFGVWIDYNQDNDFDDTGEFIYASPTSGTGVYNGNVTIPISAIPGTTRLRVRCAFSATVAATESCTNITWGETEDYNVVIQTPGPNDIGITAINNPVSGCNLSTAEAVSVDITNFGTNAQTGFNVSYQFNGGPIVTENVGTLNIASTNTSTYTFASTVNLATSGTYTMQAWTSLATDTIPLNDTTSISITSIPGVSTFPYFEDFESGNGGWLPGGAASTWAYGTPAKTTIQGAYSGTNAYVTGGLSTGQYNNNEQSFVLGPCFNFSGLSTDPWISMRVWWNSESGWDGSNLQYSTDFGTTWNNVGAFGDPNNWYNNQFITGQPGGSSEGWSGRTVSNNGSNGWVLVSHQLDGLANSSSVRLRITFGSDGSIADDGFAVDNIAIGYPPTVNLGPDSSICGGDTVILNGGPNANGRYFWSTGDTTQMDTITANNIGNGRITLILEDSLGFQAFDTVEVSISVPTVFLGPDTSICIGDTVGFGGANPGASYLWQNASTDSSIVVTNTETVWVQITDSVGCIISDTAQVTTFQAVSVNLGNDTTACVGQPVTLDAGNQPLGSTYLWSTGAGTQVLVATGPGTYWASVTTADGCVDTDTTIINTLPNPSVNLGPDRIECGPFVLDAANSGSTFQWSTNQSSQAISPNATGNYWVTVTNSLGCSTTDSVMITLTSGPVVNLGPDAILCNGQALPLDAGNPGLTYLWSTTAVTQTINVTSPGLYIVAVTDGNGCIGTDTIDITSSPLTVNLGPDRDICGDGALQLNAGNPGLTYLWSDNSTSGSLWASSAGTYWVQVTDQQGCDARDSIVVGAQTGLVADFSAPVTTNLLVPATFTDMSAGTPTSWEWDFDDGSALSTLQNPTHTYVALGNFTVRLIVNDGYCSDTTENDIEVAGVIGIEESDFIQELNVFPNPSRDVFNLNISLMEAAELGYEIRDLQGRTIRSYAAGKTPEWNGAIDLSDQSKGVYLLSIHIGDARLYRKLILH